MKKVAFFRKSNFFWEKLLFPQKLASSTLVNLPPDLLCWIQSINTGQWPCNPWTVWRSDIYWCKYYFCALFDKMFMLWQQCTKRKRDIDLLFLKSANFLSSYQLDFNQTLLFMNYTSTRCMRMLQLLNNKVYLALIWCIQKIYNDQIEIL